MHSQPAVMQDKPSCHGHLQETGTGHLQEIGTRSDASTSSSTVRIVRPTCGGAGLLVAAWTAPMILPGPARIARPESRNLLLREDNVSSGFSEPPESPPPISVV